MRRTHGFTLTSALASGLLVMGLAGCSDSAGPSDGMTAAEAADIAAAQADEVEQSAEALSLDGTTTGFAAYQAPSSGTFAAFEAARTSCATVDNTTDSDGDGAPDQATYTFALPACRFTGFRGGTLEITGSIVLSDPTPNGADFAYLATLNDFRFKFTSPDASKSYTATRNGTRQLTGNSLGVTLSNNVTTVRSVTGRSDATIVHNLQLNFTPDQGQTLERGQPLPSGTFAKSGTLTWSRDARSRTFTVTTVVPLRWDATCTTDRKISAGEIHWTLSNGNYIKTVWSACGVDPTREFVRN